MSLSTVSRGAFRSFFKKIWRLSKYLFKILGECLTNVGKYLLLLLLLQGDSLARGPKILSIKHYVTDIERRPFSASIMSRSCSALFPVCVYKFSSHYLNNIIFIDNSLGPLARESPCITTTTTNNNNNKGLPFLLQLFCSCGQFILRWTTATVY